MKRYLMCPCVLLLALTLALALPILQHAFAGEANMPSMLELARRISHEQKAARFDAFQTIERERNKAITELLVVLKSRKGDEEGEERSSTHLAIDFLASLGAVEATPVLLDMIDYRIALQAGAKRPIGSEYPCARALARIGGNRELLESLAQRIRAEESLKRRRLMIWVAYRILGGDLTQTWLKSHIQGTTGEDRERLEAAAKEVSMGNRLVSME